MIGGMVLCDRAGITYRQLDYWASCGYLKPQDEPNPGSGRTRWFPDREVEIATRMAVLTRANVKASFAAQIARQMVANGLDTCSITLDGQQRVRVTYLPPKEAA